MGRPGDIAYAVGAAVVALIVLILAIGLGSGGPGNHDRTTSEPRGTNYAGDQHAVTVLAPNEANYLGSNPTARETGDGLQDTLASSETSDSDMRCWLWDGRVLSGCTVQHSTMSDGGAVALSFIQGAQLVGAPAPGLGLRRPLEVHVHWKDMSGG